MTPKTADLVRAPEVREQIVAAARDLLANHGLEGVSMRGVAERVGVSATALYHYFENKEALVGEVVASAFREFGKHLDQAARLHPRGSYERVRALGEAYIRFAMEHEAYFRVLFSIHKPHPTSIEDLPEGGGYELLRTAVVDAMDAGAMRRADPDLLVMYLWAVVHGIVTISLACRFDGGDDHDCSPHHIDLTPGQLFHAFHDFVSHGISAAPPSASREDGGE